MGFFAESPQTRTFSARFCACVLMVMCLLPVKSKADSVSLEVRRDQRELIPITSLQSMNVRAGDVMSFRSEYGEAHEFEIQAARRSALGNRVISGLSGAGARLIMVVTSKGGLQGSIRDGDTTYRLTQTAQGLQWYYADPALARPADHGAVVRPLVRSQRQPTVAETRRRTMKLKSQQNLADQAVRYPQFGSGMATLDILFYHEAGMEDPETIAEFVTEVTNQAMVDSRIDMQVNIVGIKALDVQASLLQEEVLDQMFEGEGAFSDIETDRNFYGADLVLTLRENIPASDDACGIAYVGVYDGEPWRRLYTAVVQWLPVEAAASNYCTDTTTAHEIGHLLGSQHERRISEPGEIGAYPYSFGYYGSGFHTIMSYGDEPERPYFSNPDLIACRGFPCGLPESDPESADNARGFTQTRFMLAGYEGDTFVPELVRDFILDEECELDDGSAGFRYGHALENQTPFALDVKGVGVLTQTGEVLVSEFVNDLDLDPSYYAYVDECKADGESNPYGDDYAETWWIYADPVDGELTESLHLRWDNDYTGAYARITIATSDQGSVAGPTSYQIKPDESALVEFLPAAGYALVDVKSSCGGSLSGSVFTLDQVTSDCVIEPVFEASETSSDTLRVSLEEPVNGDTYSGVGNLRGWSVATVGVNRIEIWIDGAYAFEAPYGGERGDVGDAFPDIEGSANSGFSTAWNYNLMDLGEHTVTARAYDANGQYAESSKTFVVTRFHKPYLGQDDEVDLSGAQCSLEDSQISISDAIMDGSVYDILLEWRTAAQDFQIIEIR